MIVRPSPSDPPPKLVVCGSGLSGFELGETKLALQKSIPCVVWLDHWKNYAARFWDGNDWVIPNKVWVTDDYAREEAIRVLPIRPDKVLIKGNPYLEDVVNDVMKLRHARNEMENVLFVHEPNRTREFHKWIRHHFRSGQLLRERQHPSVRVPERTLAEDLAWADVVVGCDSMALAVAVEARRRAISVLPKGEDLHIPYPEIERIEL